MVNPYRIEGPGCVSFSGGKTSGYMLRRVMEAGSLEKGDVHVLFCDTGKEREETYEFIREVSARWGVKIEWLRRGGCLEGETPFDAVIRERKYLPNPVTRFCTQEMKIRPMEEYMTSRYGEGFVNVVGLRADEPKRVSRMRGREGRSYEVLFPLYEAGVTKEEVNGWWGEQEFKLRLRGWEGNCDLCFLKGVRLRRAILREKPELGEWWERKEREMKATFCPHSPSYGVLRKQAAAEATQLGLFGGECEVEEGQPDCACTD